MTEIQTEITGLEKTVGQILKNTRLEQKLTEEEIATQLNLSVGTIVDLENDNYDLLPVMTYVRGYISSYCKLLGIDSFEVLSNLKTEKNSKKKSQAKPAANKNKDKKAKNPFLVKSIFILLTLLVLVFVLTQLEPSPNKDESTIVELAQEVKESSLKETADSDSKDTSLASDSLGTQNNELAEELENKLELSFDSSSWVDVQTGSKEKIIYKSFAKGETHSLKAELPLSIFIDNAAGISITYEGEKIDLEQYTKNGYAKFVLEN